MIKQITIILRKMYCKIEESEVTLTPYKEAPALKVSLKELRWYTHQQSPL